MITVLCGGVGAARLLRALAEVVPAESTVGVVNTGDDTVLHGLSISPDLDTITYTLAGAIDPERGWGLRRRDVAGDGGARPLRRGPARWVRRRADVVQPRRPGPGHALLPDGAARRRGDADDGDRRDHLGVGPAPAAACR
ncbi:MAG: 2-phospho-L-lactate transferase CofD family protein [Ilumatobacteraceae bacterium]